MHAYRALRVWAAVRATYQLLPKFVQIGLWLFIRYLVYTVFINVIVAVALFLFAVYHGIRPPLEGTPYIAAIATIFSVALSLLLASFYLSLWLAKRAMAIFLRTALRMVLFTNYAIYDAIAWFGLSNKAAKNLTKVQKEKANSPLVWMLTHSLKISYTLGVMVARYRRAYIFSVALLSLVSFIVILLQNGFVNLSLVDQTSIELTEFTTFSFFSPVAGIVLAFIGAFQLLNKNLVKDIKPLIVTTALIVPAFLLPPPVMSGMLAMINYGGGIPVWVETVRPSTTRKFNLIIRTNTALFLYDYDNRRAVEISLDKIHALRSEPMRLTFNGPDFLLPMS